MISVKFAYLSVINTVPACPGLIFAYAHLTALIARSEEAFQRQDDSNRRFLFVTGPGHGAPGILASLWLEQVIHAMYPQYGLDEVGFSKFVKAFSWPGSPFPSHVNGQTPGAIHEGGELGYALAVAYGSIMDKPDLITAVVVGDGESETGPTATAWHAHKFIDPKESGAVLPIVVSTSSMVDSFQDIDFLAAFERIQNQ